MYRHLVTEIYHTVVYTLLPIDYVHDSQSATRTDFVYIKKSADFVHEFAYIATAFGPSVMYYALEKGAWLCTLSRVRKAPPT